MLRKNSSGKCGAVALCVLLSLALHGMLAWLLLSVPTPAPRKTPRHVRSVQVYRTPAPKRQEQAAAPVPPEEKKEPSFAKTRPEQAEHRPERTDYIGKRNTRAASDPDSPGLHAEVDAPAATGEQKDELVTFDQERQDGDLAHDGKERDNTARQTETGTNAPTPTPESTEPAVAGTPDATAPATPDEPQPEETDTPEDKRDATASTTPAAPSDSEEPNRGETSENKRTLPKPTLQSLGIPVGELKVDLPPPSRKPVVHEPMFHRDPALADHAQPGFRTTERRSRSVGRFVVGRNASLNVSATPLGRYEEEIYRRIAYWWYRACDDHRGDIIPGKIVVSIRLNSQGRLVNMDLIQRSGAGVIQQSFTFGAIRQASLPPMPDAVRKEMVGDLLEMIFEFNFH